MRGFLADARMLADSVHAGAPASAGPAAGAGAVSTRELSILRHLARGHDDRTIARDLVLRPATLTRHLRALCRKIGAATRADAVAYAQANGLAPDLGPPRDPGMLAILFTDIVGSTAILERLGDRDGRALLRIHDDIVREALARTDGTETKHTGDGIMATFPSVALAIACAIAIQRGIAAHNAHHPERRLGVRIGVNAGEPVSERGDVFGTTVTAAARICGHARAGQILVAEVVRHLAAGQDVRLIDRGRTKLRGFTKAVRLFELPW
jgi:class 3 adenylate cyclase